MGGQAGRGWRVTLGLGSCRRGFHSNLQTPSPDPRICTLQFCQNISLRGVRHPGSMSGIHPEALGTDFQSHWMVAWISLCPCPHCQTVFGRFPTT